MDANTRTQQYNIVYLHGTFHQGDELFSDHSRGRQCVANSIASIALSKICTIRRWTTENLDQILKHGDRFYQTLRPVEYFNQHPADSGLLEIEDIPTECDLFRRHFTISEDGCEDCLINYTDISESLHKICQRTEKCDGIVFMGNQSGAYASSFMYRNGKVYTFDPHSISPITGMPCANGTSVLLSFDSVSKFAEYLVLCASVHRHAEQLTLWKLNISKMQHSEYRDSNLMNAEHQNANIKLHTGKHKSNTIHSEVKDNPKKNSTITNCSEETESHHTKHSQQIESEQKVALTCDMCSKKLDNSYNLKLHEEKCKKKAQKFICEDMFRKVG